MTAYDNLTPEQRRLYDQAQQTAFATGDYSTEALQDLPGSSHDKARVTEALGGATPTLAQTSMAAVKRLTDRVRANDDEF
ncbi:hypothetical protein QLQ12_25040 [Actinoplanes sp. NEAU-A12]|uniref:Uncharacterized protein n=1 Tax=Actinoplanes sandaracinus TaxID=3045177 RepID=A0ABT6WQ95_9ACTN|nr:hypothetical protein [Actinoplanes sandaracinus]MDI6101889.1 hypothetical protein [Actinoplanes sandaracinus]